MFLKELEKHIKTAEERLGRLADERDRLADTLAALEGTRDENLRIVTSDNNNSEARQGLDDCDRQINALKKRIAAHKTRFQIRASVIRSTLLREQEDALASLQEDLKARHDELADLKTVLIPRAEEHLAALQEQVGSNQETIAVLQREMEKINRLELDKLF